MAEALVEDVICIGARRSLLAFTEHVNTFSLFGVKVMAVKPLPGAGVAPPS